MGYFIGVDIGTSSTKTIIISEMGKVIGQSSKEYDVINRHPLFAEQEADVWWCAVLDTIRNVVQISDINAKEVKSLGVSGLYGGSGIPVDVHMKPIYPCLIWMDRRAEDEKKWILQNLGEEILFNYTWNGVDPYYGYTKMLWIKHNEKDIWKKIKYFLPPNSYVTYKLTGEIAIDYSSAGNIGGIFDMNCRCWSNKMMNLLEIPKDFMPQRVVDCTEIVGGLKKDVANELGLFEGIPVVLTGVDCGTANFGMGIFENNMFAATLGTSMCASFITKKRIKKSNLIAWPNVYNPSEYTYYFSGANTCGAIIRWFRDELAKDLIGSDLVTDGNVYRYLDYLIADMSPGKNSLIVLPYFMGERSPIWNSNAKGVIFGLSLTHTREDLYRGFIESMGYALRDSIEALHGNIGESIVLAGGLANSKIVRQILADITGKYVKSPKYNVEANFGSAALAGVAVGKIKVQDVMSWQVFEELLGPRWKYHEIYQKLYQIYKDLYLHVKEDMQSLSYID